MMSPFFKVHETKTKKSFNSQKSTHQNACFKKLSQNFQLSLYTDLISFMHTLKLKTSCSGKKNTNKTTDFHNSLFFSRQKLSLIFNEIQDTVLVVELRAAKLVKISEIFLYSKCFSAFSFVK